MKRIAIIGAGPAGLFAAYELSNYFEVEIIEQGRDVDRRKCPVLDRKNCINCNPCNILSGLGGAGLFSDGKLNLNPKIGGDLTEFLPENKLINDSVLALVALGYRNAEAFSAVKRVIKGMDKIPEVEVIVRKALSSMN